ncbi:MAG: hypothetical protein NZ529_06070 [Cytophagaceae bacterium]|nr:hypothetical protein [Cytophagaceae bacterium]
MSTIKISDYSDSTGNLSSLIEIRPTDKFQKIDGFGGCFNELGWKAMEILSPEQRENIIKSLFDSAAGCNFNICRAPIGANDFSLNWYSLNDSINDYEMKYFSIERDKKMLIPYIKAAMKYKPSLKIWGSPWSPPAWMKSNKKYYCTNRDARIIWEPKVLKAYALYFEKYVREYRKEGINVYAVHIQNESDACQIFPSCIWTGEEQRDFIKYYLGPRFKASDLDTEIWLGTIINSDFKEQAGIVLADDETRAYITGVGYQWQGKKAVKETHEKFPNVKLMQTETECGVGDNDWNYAEKTFKLMNFYLRRGANAYMQWNMVLDEKGFSTWGWKQSAMITVDQKNKNVIYNPQYYVACHFSRFVSNGAYRIDVGGAAENTLAFLNPNGQVVVVNANHDNQPQNINLKIGNKVLQFTLPTKSFNTFIIPASFVSDQHQKYVTEPFKEFDEETAMSKGCLGADLIKIMDKGNITEYTVNALEEGYYSFVSSNSFNCTHDEKLSVHVNGKKSTPDVFVHEGKLKITGLYLSKGRNVVEIAASKRCLDPELVKVRNYKAVIPLLKNKIMIDGNEDDWGNISFNENFMLVEGKLNNTADLHVKYKQCWDKDYLYFLVQVTDDKLMSDSKHPWSDDGVEIFIDGDNNKSKSYDADDFQFIFAYNKKEVTEPHSGKVTNVSFAQKAISNGYIMEIKVPFNLIGANPEKGKEMGLEIMVNDDDGNKDGEREAKVTSWTSQEKAEQAWNDPRTFSTVILTK